jgi:polyisoprenoid-binding protein YceI
MENPVNTPTSTVTPTPAPTGPSDIEPGIWRIEPAHSEVSFTVRHLGLSKVRGRFNDFEGVLHIGENPLESRVEAAIDLASVDTNNADRDAHLRSTDFFDIEAHPRMEFRSTSITEQSLTGELTINGLTRVVTLELEFQGAAIDGYDTPRIGFSARGSISRSDFGIDFNAPLGVDGMLIGDKVSIELEIQAVPA